VQKERAIHGYNLDSRVQSKFSPFIQGHISDKTIIDQEKADFTHFNWTYSHGLISNFYFTHLWRVFNAITHYKYIYI
jgi:hypothetical protein